MKQNDILLLLVFVLSLFLYFEKEHVKG